MAAQGSAPAALDETASQVDDTIDDDVTDLSESEDDGFESEYDTIADQFFWNGVPWSVLADNTRLNRLNPWQDVDDDDPLLHKNRAKRDGSNRWVRYVPEWTDPDYDEKWEVLEVTDDEPMRRRRGVGDVYQRLRPALRPLDVLRNPTEWARRYGIHPDQGDGRSRMTPVKAGGRRFHLNGLRTTPDGQQKTFLDMGDLDAAEREFHRSGGAEMGLTYLQGLEQLATRDPEAPEAEIAAGLLTLLGGIARDEFHQRHMFPGHTTDEVCDLPSGLITAFADTAVAATPTQRPRHQWERRLGPCRPPTSVSRPHRAPASSALTSPPRAPPAFSSATGGSPQKVSATMLVFRYSTTTSTTSWASGPR